jgi:large subunit ribosomal protein L21e
VEKMTLHKGYRNKTRKRHKKKVREKGLRSIDKYLIDYETGNKVDIITDPSHQKRGMPHRRYHGLTGTIIGERGRSYEVEVRLGNSKKKLFIGKEHLRLNKGSQI